MPLSKALLAGAWPRDGAVAANPCLVLVTVLAQLLATAHAKAVAAYRAAALPFPSAAQAITTPYASAGGTAPALFEIPTTTIGKVALGFTRLSGTLRVPADPTRTVVGPARLKLF